MPEKPTDSDRIVDLETSRVFRTRGVVARFPLPLTVDYLNPVPVLASGSSIRLGWAALQVVGNTLLADIVFDWATPERFDIETGTRKLFARARGLATLTESPFEQDGLFDDDLFMSDCLGEVMVIALEISSDPAYEGQPDLSEWVP